MLRTERERFRLCDAANGPTGSMGQCDHAHASRLWACLQDVRQFYSSSPANLANPSTDSRGIWSWFTMESSSA
ncbi:hypothetical protein SAMN04487926_104132 [Paraburkholderia steynii]|uniref:Uncharacterized protein n=1 Tax=Paraburkholderia steynii TaxID=1245441 RepID=A0A7Z7B358_9BURK|nr:hypothetical protein SAMN04487926_104132 [Paraburkholderia steynii]